MSNDSVIETVTAEITRRAQSILKAIQPHWTGLYKSGTPPTYYPFHECYIAGGCLSKHIRDVDIFPADMPVSAPNLPLIAKTANAATYKADPWPIQITNYHRPSLMELIESFDFAHVQVGAKISLGEKPKLIKVEFTQAYLAAQASQTSWFCGSAYPLSSLIRVSKYQADGAFGSRTGHIKAVIGIVNAMIERGVRDYNDFKDQLDAIDMGMLPEELKDVESADLAKLYDLLLKGTK